HQSKPPVTIHHSSVTSQPSVTIHHSSVTSQPSVTIHHSPAQITATSHNLPVASPAINNGGRRITYGVLRHLTDSQAWRTINEKFSKIAKDLRNLQLGISVDGVDVNSRTRNHSVWPVLSVIYNLPPWLCMKRKFFMLSVLISGYPGNDIDVF
nr:hypothetical protein [Tanacetum cinerariifolium]